VFPAIGRDRRPVVRGWLAVAVFYRYTSPNTRRTEFVVPLMFKSIFRTILIISLGVLLVACSSYREMQQERQARAELEGRAENGDATAQYELGRRYNVGKDPAQAIYWLCRAAKQGHTGAQYTLAGLFERQAGSTGEAGRSRSALNDEASAYFWYTAAASLGHEQAFAARDRVAGKMSAQDVLDVKRRARGWRDATCLKP